MFSAGFVVSLGFAWWRYAGLWSFWPLAVVQQAQAAIVLVVLRRLGGAVLFRSSRPSPNSGYPFRLLALTFRSSRPAFGGRLTSPVSLRKTRFIQPHVLFTGIYLFKRLFVGFWVSCRASPFGAAPVSNIFCKHCAASVAHCFFTVCARRQFGASHFGFCG